MSCSKTGKTLAKRLVQYAFAVMLFVFAGCISVSAQTIIPDDAFEYNGHYYKIFNDIGTFSKLPAGDQYTAQQINDETWDLAVKLCKKRGGHLAVLTTKEENDAVTEYFNSTGIGRAIFGIRYNGKKGWQWVTEDDKYDFSNWGYSSNGEDPEGDPNYKETKPIGELNSRYVGDKWYYDDFPSEGWTGNLADGFRPYICEWESGKRVGEYTKEDGEKMLSDGELTKGTDSYYMVFNNPLGYNDASQFCRNIGGHLVDVSSNTEYKAVRELLDSSDKNKKKMYWIGVRFFDDSNGWFIDHTGVAPTFTFWDNPNPDNSNGADYVALNYNKKSEEHELYKWIPLPEYGREDKEDMYYLNFGFICEFDIICKSAAGEFFTHDPGEWEIDSAPTCTQPGHESLWCQRCKQPIDSQELEQVSHIFVYQNYVNNISVPGLKKKVCTECGASTVDFDWRYIWILPTPIILLLIYIAAYFSARKDFKEQVSKSSPTYKVPKFPFYNYVILAVAGVLIFGIIYFFNQLNYYENAEILYNHQRYEQAAELYKKADLFAGTDKKSEECRQLADQTAAE